MAISLPASVTAHEVVLVLLRHSCVIDQQFQDSLQLFDPELDGIDRSFRAGSRA